ncbi:histidinol dehydrogenase [Microbacterium sp. LMI1-1-1.1]|uniref:histidinol dehydrogenase n=1 Tax=unclassified Microbacterium TaxID=2609290 RepID=UPI003467CD86
MGFGLSRVLGWLMAAVIGLFYGVAATVGHAYRIGFFPLGLLLATVGTAALLIALRTLTRDRVNALAGGIGVVAATFVFSQVGPGGSAIVAAATPDTEWIAVAWTIIGPVLVALVAAWPDLSHLRAAPAPPER